jgi:hypothetical protein
MSKLIRRVAVVVVLGFSVLLPLAGCQQDNQAGIATGTQGTSDPKYAKDDDATYQAYAKDQMQKGSTGKTDTKSKKR